MQKYPETLPQSVIYELHALDRCIESQRGLARRIDAENPGDPYASLMVDEDVMLLEDLKARVISQHLAVTPAPT